MSRSNRRPRYARGLRHVAATTVLFAIPLTPGARLEAQDPSPDTAAATVPSPPESGLPLFLTLGVGYGQRLDRCAYCASARNTQSFTGHVSIESMSPAGSESAWTPASGGEPTQACRGQSTLSGSRLLRRWSTSLATCR